MFNAVTLATLWNVNFGIALAFVFLERIKTWLLRNTIVTDGSDFRNQVYFSDHQTARSETMSIQLTAEGKQNSKLQFVVLIK